MGSLPLDGLGLPKRRAREMVLARAWEEVAGEAISGRAWPLRLVRGVLEIEIADGPWAETVGQLLPALAGRLSASHPGLGVRKCRLVRSGSLAREAPRDLELQRAAESGTIPRPAAATNPSRSQTTDEGDVAERLPAIARRYLERNKG